MQLREMLVSLNPQELFDTAIRGMAQQGYRCNLYTRKSTGDHCAVGHCLTPEAQDYLLRSARNRDTIPELTKDDSSISVRLVEFLEDLQVQNDVAVSREQFYVLMGRLGDDYALSLSMYHAVLTEAWRASSTWKR